MKEIRCSKKSTCRQFLDLSFDLNFDVKGKRVHWHLN